MYRRALITATLAVAVLLLAAPQTGAQDEPAINVLLLPDTVWSPADGYGAGTDALIGAFDAADFDVTVGPIEYEWNGTNPPLSEFDAVVHLNGATAGVVMPVEGQEALVEFVSNGGGYVGGQWNGFEVEYLYLTDMEDLVLQLWTSIDKCERCYVTWTPVPEEQDHPVLAGFSGAVAVFADAHASGRRVDFGVYPSVVLMTSPAGEPAVTVRKFEAGRVVAFSVAPNYDYSDLTLQDWNIQSLYVNAVSWAVSPSTAPQSETTIEALMNLVIGLRDSGAINKGRANALLAKLDGAARQLARGNLDAAEKRMWGFVNQVEVWMRSGVLTLEDGNSLLVVAYGIIADLAG